MNNQGKVQTQADRQSGFVSMADLCAVKPYKGPLNETTFGDPVGSHVAVSLPGLTVTLYDGERWLYEIDLERCLTPAQLLDWIFQVAAKTWMSAELLRLTIEALDCALHPQATLCSWGQPSTINRGDLRRLVESNVRSRIGWEQTDPGRIPIAWKG